MIWLVTGGAGFIGSHFIYYLLEHYPKDQVICFDKLTYSGNLMTLEVALKNENFTFVRGDIADREAAFSLFKNIRPDVVVNFAAETHVDRSILGSEDFIRTNILGVSVLLDACREYGVARFHQVSTDEVYGDLPLDRPDLAFHELSPIEPSNPYSASKASADLLVLAYARTHGVPVSLTRCSNNYGPYHFPEKLIPLVITRAMQNLTIPVYGTGDNVRDWLYVEDHCTAIDLVIQHGEPGSIYNIGGDAEKNNLHVVKTILGALGKPESLITFVKDRPGHDKRYAIDTTKLNTELGWSAKTTFESGIEKTVDWYRKNEHWWQTILNGDYRHYYEQMYGKHQS